MAIMSAVKGNYADAGFMCVIEGAVAARAEVLLAAAVVAPHPLRVVILAAPLEVSEARDAQRTGKNVATHFRHLHPLMHRELVGVGAWVDSTDLTPSETVDVILDLGDTAIVKIDEAR